MAKVETVKSKDLSGAEVVLVVKSPSPKNFRDAQVIYNKALRTALEGGSILRRKLNEFLTEQKVWDSDKENNYQKILKEISDHEDTIKAGGISLKRAKEVALELRDLRLKLRELLSERQTYDATTAEGQADNTQFNFLVSVCTFKEDGNSLMWSKLEDYDNSREPYAADAASTLAKMIYDLDPDYDNNLVENKFLKKFKFVRDDLRLVNKDGHLIDEDGRLINENGRFVAYREDGTQYFVNRDGEEVDESGEKKITVLPFLDDDGNPIVEETVASASEPEKVEEKTQDEPENV
jgi:hypothetical protein